MNLYKPFAFIKKDFTIATSYKLPFVFEFFGIFASALTFYFIAKLFGENANPYLKSYEGQYFPFVLIGIAFSNYLRAGIVNFSTNIRKEQMQGTLEIILQTPIKTSFVIILMSLWNFIFSSINILVYLLLGKFLFKVNFAGANFFAASILLFLTIISFSSLGIISAGFTIMFKKNLSLNWLINSSFRLLGGVYYPVTILPEFLQTISRFLPITYSLKGLRLALLKGYSTSALMQEISILTIFCIVLLPASLLFFVFSVKKAKIDGSLTHY